MAKKIPHLSARPMLLAHIDDLIKSKKQFHYAYELYAVMVKAWIERERGFIEDPKALNEFSERLAVNIFVNSLSRKAERIPKDELTILAKDWGISLEDWKLTGRSLLNRDAEGSYKFAHRSIMEYLFVRRFLAGEQLCATVEWTDQMRDFLWEILQDQTGKNEEWRLADVLPWNFRENDLTARLLCELAAGWFEQSGLSKAFLYRSEIPRGIAARTALSVIEFILYPGARMFEARMQIFIADRLSLVNVFYFASGDFKPGEVSVTVRQGNYRLEEMIRNNVTHLFDRTTSRTWLIMGSVYFPVGLVMVEGDASHSHQLQEAFSKSPWMKRAHKEFASRANNEAV